MSYQQKAALMSAHKSLVKKGYYSWANSVLHFLNGSKEDYHWAIMALSTTQNYQINFAV